VSTKEKEKDKKSKNKKKEILANIKIAANCKSKCCDKYTKSEKNVAADAQCLI